MAPPTTRRPATRSGARSGARSGPRSGLLFGILPALLSAVLALVATTPASAAGVAPPDVFAAPVAVVIQPSLPNEYIYHRVLDAPPFLATRGRGHYVTSLVSMTRHAAALDRYAFDARTSCVDAAGHESPGPFTATNVVPTQTAYTFTTRQLFVPTATGYARCSLWVSIMSHDVAVGVPALCTHRNGCDGFTILRGPGGAQLWTGGPERAATQTAAAAPAICIPSGRSAAVSALTLRTSGPTSPARVRHGVEVTEVHALSHLPHNRAGDVIGTGCPQLHLGTAAGAVMQVATSVRQVLPGTTKPCPGSVARTVSRRIAVDLGQHHFFFTQELTSPAPLQTAACPGQDFRAVTTVTAVSGNALVVDSGAVRRTIMRG